jgi:O-antigen ligase
VAPVIAIAVMEAALGVLQFSANPHGESGFRSVSGSYVNRNHFAGLLELAFPLTLAWAPSLWADGRRRFSGAVDEGRRSTASVVGIAMLLGAAVCIQAGVIVSLSRMGFAATLAALMTVTWGWLVRRRRKQRTAVWLWLVPIVLSAAIVLMSTDGMVMRLGDSATTGVFVDGRVQLWRDSFHLFRAYPWTGAGLGTFEHALYPFRTWLPTSAVDYAHNDYLQILAELGVVGFGLATAFAVSVMRRSVTAALCEHSRYAWLGLGLFASFVAIALHSVMDFNLYIPANALALAWLSGVAVSPELRATR